VKQLCSLTLALFTIAGALSNAQTLHVKLVNGISAKPISNAYVNVWVGDQRKEALPISVDINGIATLSLTSNVSDVHVQAESIRWPTFLYAPEIRVQAGFVLCQVTQQKYSWLKVTTYPTAEWARIGLVTANTCGKAVASPEPRVLTIFVRPLTFWERLSQ
jgi:hypothetical protein